MEALGQFVSAHLWAVLAGAAGLLLLYVVLKSLVKLFLVAVLAAAAVGAYLYLREPAPDPRGFLQEAERARQRAGEMVDQGRGILQKGREFYDQGKRLFSGREAPPAKTKEAPEGTRVVPKGKEKKPLRKG